MEEKYMYLFEQYSIITIDHDNCNDGQKPFATEKI